MKKIISFLVVIATIISIASVSVSAAGSLVFSDNFENGFAARNWCTDPGACAFKWDGDNQCIMGYRDAVVLQSNFDQKWNKVWDKFYASFDVQIRGFDQLPDEVVTSHGVSMWYADSFGLEYSAIYFYNVEIETGKVTLSKDYKFKYEDEYGITQDGVVNQVIASGQIENYTIEVAEDAEWFNIGMRVSSGLIECYFNEQLVLSSKASDSTQKIGPVSVDSVDETVGSIPSAVLFWNHGNWVALDNFEVWTDDYDFKSQINYGDVNSDNKINMTDASLMLQKIAGWSVNGFVDGASDANGDGKFNLNDVTRLLQYIADWDVKLGPVAE